MSRLEDILMLAEKFGKRSQVIDTARELRSYSPGMGTEESYEMAWEHIKKDR
tara:strand:+ start:1582 stop:1737 length:156 start_codon:yes stop_codon:yes gene_type:complete